MRKFHVEFDVETDEDGFVQSTTRDVVLRALSPADRPFPVAVVPKDATITEIIELKDGYYYRLHDGLLYERKAGKWYVYSRNEGKWEDAYAQDDKRHKGEMYLGKTVAQ